MAQARDIIHAISNGKDGLLKWYVIDDVVMGGRSKSSVSADKDGKMQFQGSLSTVGGGFCSCRTHEDAAIAAATTTASSAEAGGGGGGGIQPPTATVVAAIQGAIQRGVYEISMLHTAAHTNPRFRIV